MDGEFRDLPRLVPAGVRVVGGDCPLVGRSDGAYFTPRHVDNAEGADVPGGAVRNHPNPALKDDHHVIDRYLFGQAAAQNCHPAETQA